MSKKELRKQTTSQEPTSKVSTSKQPASKQPASKQPASKPSISKELSAKQPTQSKAGKKQKNLYLSDQARQLLAVFALNTGISETAVVELLLREKAARENVSLPESGAA